MNRYDRQIQLEEIGILGQKNLAQAKVLCVGAGGLGSPILLYLASAGVGTIAIVDGDKIALTNLQRQILFTEAELGQAKASVAKKKLEKLNSDIDIIAFTEFLTEANATSLFENYDLIIDGTDNFQAKFLINKVARQLEKPWIYGSVSGFEGQLAFFDPHGSCLQCLLPLVPKQNLFSCAETGVLGAMVGWIGAMQALEAIRFLTNNKSSQLISQLLYVDGLNYSQRKFKIPQRAECPVCSNSSKEGLTQLLATHETAATSHTKINPKDYLVIDLCEEHTAAAILADFHYSISDLFTQKNIPTDWLESKKPLLFYCESGHKSQTAVSYLQTLGYRNVTHLVGGLTEWQKNSDELLKQ